MKADLKKEARKLRRKGLSFREISEKIGISKSTASLWLRDVELSQKAKERIQKLGTDGRRRGKKTVENRIALEDENILNSVRSSVDSCKLLKNDLKIVCALLYWCEGGKTEKSKLSFVNSDPVLVRYYIDNFRKAFELDESRFRPMIHIHEYHNADTQTKFWSDITRIPVSQFTRPYNKPNTGKRTKKDYQGCISLRYYGRKIREEMMFLIDEISKK